MAWLGKYIVISFAIYVACQLPKKFNKHFGCTFLEMDALMTHYLKMIYSTVTVSDMRIILPGFDMVKRLHYKPNLHL